MKNLFPDFHTHHKPVLANSCVVYNAPWTEGIGDTRAYCSVGLHPWDTATETDANVIAFFEKMVKCSQVIAVGEIGLDKLRGAAISQQIRLFEVQARWAETVRKPVIIHCVKAWDHLLQIKASVKPQQPWIVHGFGGKLGLAEQLIRAGMVLSFGEKICKNPQWAEQVFARLPDQSILLETDESATPIEEIYRMAARHRNQTEDELCLQMTQRWYELFKIHEKLT